MSEYIQNKYGKVFKIEKYNLDGRPDTERTMYICTNCYNFYILFQCFYSKKMKNIRRFEIF